MNIWKRTARVLLVAGTAFWMYSEAQNLSTLPADPAFNPQPESEIASESEAVSESEVISEAETEVVSESESESEAVSEVATEAVSESETDSESESEAASELETESESETASENESEAVSESETDSESESEAASELETESESETVSENETEAESETSTAPEGESESETASESETESESETSINTESAYYDYSFRRLRLDLTSMISEYEGTWSVYVKDLSDDTSLSINAQPQASASLIKLYIAGAVLEEIEAGNLERTETIDQLLSAMITVSDNESSNELVRYLSDDHDHLDGMLKVNLFIDKHGYADTHQYNGLEDPAVWYDESLVNSTSVTDCGRLLEEIYEGDYISHLASRQIEGYLLDQELTWKIPMGIPSDITTANKTGEKDDTQNDVALVYTPYGDYIICVMATDLTDNNAAIEHIRSISETVYEFFSERGALNSLEVSK